VRGRGLVAAPHRHTLSDVAPTVRALLGIEGQSGARGAREEGEPIPEIVDR
jgi:hypothetical protein